MQKKRRIIRIDASPPRPERLRVAAYCRVSTCSPEQELSLESQRLHWEEAVSKREDWVLVDIYYERGVSGTKKESRPELQRMLYDCRDGRIDLIITRSISRFARNMTDCLEMIRLLGEYGVRLIFEQEHLDTQEVEDEFLLTVLSSLAEEESRSVSENVRWTIQRRFRSGTYRYSKAPYGYRLRHGSFVIEPKEAEVVRWMYEQVLSGKGTPWIASELNRWGVLKSPKHVEKPAVHGLRLDQMSDTKQKILWHAKTVQKIVTNVTYLGDVLMQKTYTDDAFKRWNNFGEETRFYMDHHHAPIIDAESFSLACEAIRQRGREAGNISEPDEHQNIHNRHYCFSGKLICGTCGSNFIRIVQRTHHGMRFHWGCSLHKRNAGRCPQMRVSEETIQSAFLTMLYKLSYSRGLILDVYLEDLRRFEKEGKRKAGRRDMSVRTQEQIKNIRALRRYTEDFQEEEFPEDAFKAFVDRVVVYSRTEFVFCLSCGLNLREVTM